VELSQESCAKAFLDQIDRADILQFITTCRKHISKRTGEPVSDRTVHNIFQNVNTFFLQNPIVVPFDRAFAAKFGRADNDKSESVRGKPSWTRL
jgi:hypothetical protein